MMGKGPCLWGSALMHEHCAELGSLGSPRRRSTSWQDACMMRKGPLFWAGMLMHEHCCAEPGSLSSPRRRSTSRQTPTAPAATS